MVVFVAHQHLLAVKPTYPHGAPRAAVTVIRGPSVPQQPGEDGRFADLRVPGRGQQRHSPPRRKLAQVRQRAGPFRLCQFRLVAPG